MDFSTSKENGTKGTQESENIDSSSGMNEEMESELGNQLVSEMLESAYEDTVPEFVMKKMSAAFGTNLMGLHIYRSTGLTGSGIRGMASGNRIILDAAAPSLDSAEGQKLLGHEIAHAIAQANGETGGKAGLIEDATQEKMADAAGEKAAEMDISGEPTEYAEKAGAGRKKAKRAMHQFAGRSAAGYEKAARAKDMLPAMNWADGKAVQFFDFEEFAHKYPKLTTVLGTVMSPVGRFFSRLFRGRKVRNMTIEDEKNGNITKLNKSMKAFVGESYEEQLERQRKKNAANKDNKEKIINDIRSVPMIWETATIDDTTLEPEMEVHVEQSREGSDLALASMNAEVGHTFITLRYTKFNWRISRPVRYRVSFGFYPAFGFDYKVALGTGQTYPGVLTNDRYHVSDVGRSYKISIPQVNTIFARAEKYPQYGYNLLSRNCTTFVHDMMQEAGVQEKVEDGKSNTSHELDKNINISEEIFRMQEWKLTDEMQNGRKALMFAGNLYRRRTRNNVFVRRSNKMDMAYANAHMAPGKGLLTRQDMYQFDASQNMGDLDFYGFNPGAAGEKLRYANKERAVVSGNMNSLNGKEDFNAYDVMDYAKQEADNLIKKLETGSDGSPESAKLQANAHKLKEIVMDADKVFLESSDEGERKQENALGRITIANRDIVKDFKLKWVDYMNKVSDQINDNSESAGYNITGFHVLKALQNIKDLADSRIADEMDDDAYSDGNDNSKAVKDNLYGASALSETILIKMYKKKGKYGNMYDRYANKVFDNMADIQAASMPKHSGGGNKKSGKSILNSSDPISHAMARKLSKAERDAMAMRVANVYLLTRQIEAAKECMGMSLRKRKGTENDLKKVGIEVDNLDEMIQGQKKAMAGWGDDELISYIEDVRKQAMNDKEAYNVFNLLFGERMSTAEIERDKQDQGEATSKFSKMDRIMLYYQYGIIREILGEKLADNSRPSAILKSAEEHNMSFDAAQKAQMDALRDVLKTWEKSRLKSLEKELLKEINKHKAVDVEEKKYNSEQERKEIFLAKLSFASRYYYRADNLSEKDLDYIFTDMAGVMGQEQYSLVGKSYDAKVRENDEISITAKNFVQSMQMLTIDRVLGNIGRDIIQWSKTIILNKGLASDSDAEEFFDKNSMAEQYKTVLAEIDGINEESGSKEYNEAYYEIAQNAMGMLISGETLRLIREKEQLFEDIARAVTRGSMAENHKDPEEITRYILVELVGQYIAYAAKLNVRTEQENKGGKKEEIPSFPDIFFSNVKYFQNSNSASKKMMGQIGRDIKNEIFRAVVEETGRKRSNAVTRRGALSKIKNQMAAAR